MADANSSGVATAIKSDGFIDFYELLGTPADATTTRLRSRINDLYSEAQANRDHRNMGKRREYELLLDLLPQCRTALLDENKRARYDAYAAEAKAGNAAKDFEAFMNDLGGKSDEDAEERASLLAAANTGAKKAPATSTAPKKKVSRKAQTSIMGSAIAVIAFFFVVIVLKVALNQNIGIALVAGGVVGVVIWVATYIGNKKKVAR